MAELGGSLFCDELVRVSFVLSPRALFCVLSLEGSICAELEVLSLSLLFVLSLSVLLC